MMHFAAPRSTGTFISYLIGKGAKIEALDSYNRTSLHRAAAQDDICPVQTLVDGGANIYSKDKSGLTPLHRPQLAVKKLLWNTCCQMDAELIPKACMGGRHYIGQRFLILTFPPVNFGTCTVAR